MDESYKIRICHESLAFSAAHFITFGAGQCESLHGHNYRVAVELEGSLDENGYVYDFLALRTAVEKIVKKLDHAVLLPADHPQIEVLVSGEETVARFGDRRWAFPASECVVLPLANTTAELLARHIGIELSGTLAETPKSGQSFRAVTVEVEECPGQTAVCRLSISVPNNAET